jgi:hypothetical protein
MNISESIRRHVTALQPVCLEMLAGAMSMKRSELWDHIGGMLRREHLVKGADGKLSIGRHIVAKVKGQGRYSRLNRDSYNKRAENATTAREMRNKEIGIRGGFVPTIAAAQSVEEFIAKGGQVQRLANGEVSASSRLMRIGVAT